MREKFEIFLESKGLRKYFLENCNMDKYENVCYVKTKDLILNTLPIEDMGKVEKDSWIKINRVWNKLLDDMDYCRAVVVLTEKYLIQKEINDYICLGYELFGCTDNKVIMIRRK